MPQGRDRRGPAGMREEDGESTPGFVYSLERAGRGLQEFSQGRHPDGAAIISKTHSSASLSLFREFPRSQEPKSGIALP